MDSLSTQKTKSRKTKRLAKKYRTQMVMDLFFQATEVIVVLVTVAKLCHQLVITFGDINVAAVILSNRTLAFALGNAIVIALIAKSGFLFNQELDPKCKSNYFCEEFVPERSRGDGIERAQVKNREKQGEAEKEAKQSITETRTKQSEADKEKQSKTENIAKQSISNQMEKQSVTEKKTKQSISLKREKPSKPEKFKKQSISEKQSIVEHPNITVNKAEKRKLIEKRQSQSYQRSRSENLEGLEESSCGRLRRSETDASCERFDSDDELRYKIESFIARQRRNQLDD